MMKKAINHLYCKVIYTVQRFGPEQSEYKSTQAHASPGKISIKMQDQTYITTCSCSARP